MMIVMSRRVGEAIVINNEVTITVIEIRPDCVRLAIDTPRDVPVHRREVYEVVRRVSEPE